MIILLAFSSESEKELFEQMYVKYKKLVFFKAMEILHHEASAEDVVSETYLRLFRNIHKVSHVDTASRLAFLMTIAKNVALTMREKESRYQVVEFAEEYIETASEVVMEEDIIARMAASDIMSLVDQLSEELKAVFVLKFGYDLSHREIAEILNISENNVTVRIFRAKKKLAALVAGAAGKEAAYV